LESCRSFRGPLLLKPVSGQALFFAVSYSKPALVCLVNLYYFATLFKQLDALFSIIKIGAEMTEKAFFKEHQNAPEFMVCLGLGHGLLNRWMSQLDL
jgi:hypothetical protein